MRMMMINKNTRPSFGQITKQKKEARHHVTAIKKSRTGEPGLETPGLFTHNQTFRKWNRFLISCEPMVSPL